MTVLSLQNIRGTTYLDAPWCSWDLETTNKEYGDSRNPANWVVCGSWQTGRGDVLDGPAQGFYGDVFEHAPFRAALQATADAGGYWIAQHCKFEAGWALRNGIDAPAVLWADPMLWEWVLLGNNPRRQRLALEVLAPKYGAEGKEQFIAALMAGGVCPSEQPAHLLLDRCIRDVESTAHVARAQLRLLKQRGQLHLAAQRCLLAPVLAAMARNPITVHRGRVLTAHETYTERRHKLQAEWDSITRGASLRAPLQAIPLVYGIHPHKELPPRLTKAGKPRRVKDKLTGKMMPAPEPEQCKCPTCAPHMQAQLRAESLGFSELTDRRRQPKRNKPTKSWPDGQPKLSKPVLAALARQPTLTDKQAHWLKLRQELGQVLAALSKNLDFFKGVVLERDGVFYSDIMQAVTATHRLSGRGLPQEFEIFRDPVTGKAPLKSTQPQNMPREFKVLQTTGRGPDWESSGADAKQLEFRFAVFLGQDAKGMADIRNPDFDAHLQTLTVMLHGSLDQREYRKLLDLYRAGDAHVKWQRNDNMTCKAHTYKPLFGGERGTPREEAYYTWFREHYSGITSTCQGWLDEVVQSARNDPQRYKNEHGNWCGTGSFRAPSGLIFSYDIELKQRSSGEVVAFDRHSFKPVKPAIFNQPVQDLATGECVPIAVICLYHRVRNAALRVFMTNTVHDSVDAEVHKDDKPRYRAAVFKAFTSDVLHWFENAYGITFNVPLGCEVSFGQFLGEGEHSSYDTK